MTKIERVSRESFNLVQERYQKLKELFPEVFTEGKIDFTKLRATFGDLIDDRPERYLFTWAGKTEAIKSLQTSSWATLIPCPEESIDFDKANHIFIEGENLEVLKLLLKPYFGRVKMIYIDPPYNRGGEFIYRDDYKQPLDAYLKQTGQIDGNGNHMTSKLETNGRYHSAWLSMMYPRLFLARQLLKDDGVIFVSIDDNEIHNLRLLMNEVFGEENAIAILPWKGRGGRQDSTHIAEIHEFVLFYAKNKELFVAGEMAKENEVFPKYDEVKKRRYKTQLARKWGVGSRRTDRPNLYYPIIAPDGSEVYPKLPNGEDGRWRWDKKRMEKEIAEGNIEFVKDGDEWIVYEKIWEPTEDEKRTKKFTTWLDDVGSTASGTKELKAIFDGQAPFDFPKPVTLLKRLIQIANTDDDSIIVDFFAGSCTTAHAVLELNMEDGLNRQFIMVQFPEPTPEDSEARKMGYKTIAEVGKERIRRVIRGYGDDPKPMEGVGFKVFKLAPSNFKQWEDYTGNNPDEYLEQLSLFQTTLVDDYRNIDVIYEVILKEGYDLNSQIEQVENVTGNTVFRITDPVRDQFFYLCLDKQIHLEALEPLSLKEDDLFICLDTALDDTTKANLALQCRLKTI
jgi:adenine-specific DNA-methyltransferase